MDNVDVSIILVNYKTSELLTNALNSVIEKSAGFSYEAIVVDNSEDKEEFAKLENLQKDNIHLIDAKANLGFGKANNLGAAMAKGNYLYFLNADTILMNNAINELKDFLDKHPDVGAVGSNLFTKERCPNHSFIPFEKNIKGERRINSLITSLKRKIGNKRIDFNYSNKPLEIKGYVCGASLMIRKDLFKKMGGFDKDIFMYAEESLLCYRVIHETSFRIFNVPSSKIIHLEGGSFKGMNYPHAKLIADGNFVYYSKAFGKEYALRVFEYFKRFYRLKTMEHCIIGKAKKDCCLHLYQAFREKIAEVSNKN